MARIKTHTGIGGKSFQDRELAARVRTLSLTEIEKVLKNPKMTPFKQQLILRMAGAVVPRLVEHSGEGGGPIKLEGIEISFNSKKGNEAKGRG